MADHILLNGKLVGKLKRVYCKAKSGELTIILDASEPEVAQGYMNDLWAGFGDETISIEVKSSQVLFNDKIIGKLKRVYCKVNTGELTIILDTSKPEVARGYANDLWLGFGDKTISIEVKLSQE